MRNEFECPGILFGVYLEYIKDLFDRPYEDIDPLSREMKKRFSKHVCVCGGCGQRYKRAIEVIKQRVIKKIRKKFNPKDITPELSEILRKVVDRTLLEIL